MLDAFARFVRLHRSPWADPREQRVPDVTGPYYASADDQDRFERTCESASPAGES